MPALTFQIVTVRSLLPTARRVLSALKDRVSADFAPCHTHLSRTVLVFIQARAIPNSHRAIVARAYEIATVGAEDQIKNISVVFPHHTDYPAGHGVPDF